MLVSMKAKLSHWLVNSLESAFVHPEIMKVPTAEPCAPVIGTQEGALTVEMHVTETTCLHQLPFLLY